MTIQDVLHTWDEVFPGAHEETYPESWAIKMWAQRYTTEEFQHAAQVTAIAVKDGRVSPTEIGRYLSGVLRKNKIESAEVDAEIKKHRAARGYHVVTL